MMRFLLPWRRLQANDENGLEKRIPPEKTCPNAEGNNTSATFAQNRRTVKVCRQRH
ncbi:hypothetical protein MTYP_01789 [Methylophilaceae bacterium]|nr:hypothetical protein MTYP_01789 [Methylophilaceae bacterium]